MLTRWLEAQPLHVQVRRSAGAACPLLLHRHELLHDVSHDICKRLPLLRGAAAAAAGCGSRGKPPLRACKLPSAGGLGTRHGVATANAAAAAILGTAVLAPAPKAHSLAAATAAGGDATICAAAIVATSYLGGRRDRRPAPRRRPCRRRAPPAAACCGRTGATGSMGPVKHLR